MGVKVFSSTPPPPPHAPPHPPEPSRSVGYLFWCGAPNCNTGEMLQSAAAVHAEERARARLALNNSYV